MEYQIAFRNEDGSFDIVETFEAGSDSLANAYAENYGGEWYVLRDGVNINANI